MASSRSAYRPPRHGCAGGTRPSRVLALLALLLCVALGVVSADVLEVDNYDDLKDAIEAKESHVELTNDIVFAGSLLLRASLTLTGSCGGGDQPCLLDGKTDAATISAHFVVPRGFSLSLNNLVLANGGRGGNGGESCLGAMASGIPDPLTGLNCTAPKYPPKPRYTTPGNIWRRAETLCGRLQCGTVVVAASASLNVSRCSFVNNTGESDGTYVARGSAISILATAGFSISDSSFVGNAVQSTYASLAHGGGAVSIMQPFNSMQFVPEGGALPPMLIQNTLFEQNVVYGLGGALYSQLGVGTLQILNCSFHSNTAFGLGTATTGLGGAVAVTFMKFNSPFLGANISHYLNPLPGAGVDTSFPDLENADFDLHAHYTISDTAFVNNTAIPLLASVPSPTSGGALFFGGGGYGATLTRCNLTSNTAARGGAIYYRGQSLESVLVLDEIGLHVIPFNTHGVQSLFTASIPNTGPNTPYEPLPSTEYWTDEAYFVDRAFSDHFTFLQDADYLALQQTNADYNSLAPVAQVSGYMITLVDCTVSSNTATFLAPETAGRGGAVYVACGALNASGTVFLSNAALAGTGFSAGLGSYGGAVYASNECPTPDLTSFVTTSVTLLNSVFRNNSAASEGGALAAENADPSALQSAASITVSATGTSFYTNSAIQGRGGALFGDSFAAFTLQSCTAVNNQASQGGAVHASGALAASQSSFSGNAAAQQGGALYVAAAASFTAVNFTANRAAVGGALFVDGVASLDACLFASNSAVNGSALAVAAGSNMSASASTRIRGHAASQFGTVFVSGSTARLALAALFTNNTAQAGGSVFYDAIDTSNAAQPGSGDDQVVLNYGPKAASLPAAARFAVNGLPVAGSTAVGVASKSGALLLLNFTLSDGFGQLVDAWRDAAFDVSCTAFAAPGAAPAACPPDVLRGTRHAAYFDGSSFVNARVFAQVGASALLTAVLQSPTVPLLLPPAGLSYTVNVTVAQCAPLETFDEGQLQCVCAVGNFLNASLGACSTCPAGSNALQPRANYCNPNPPGYVSTTQTTLNANVTLAGVSAANFTASTRAALTASLAATLGAPASAVNVTGVVDAPVSAGRRLLAASAVAAYAVTTTNGSLASSLRTTLGNAAALGTSLTAALQSSGDPALAQVTGAVPAPPTEVSVVLPPQACPRGTYLDSLSQACQTCQSPLVTTSIGATACEPCQPRFAWASAALCVACPRNSVTSPNDAGRCACEAGYYDTLHGGNVTAPVCAACPIGGACTTGFVGAAEGWWRADTRSAVFYQCRVDECLLENITGPLSALQLPPPPPGLPSDNCVDGNTGPFCAVCKDGYALQSGACAPCKPQDAWDSWSQRSKAGLLVGCIVAGLFVLAIAFLQPVWPALERAADAAISGATEGARRASDAGSACFRRCCCRGPPPVDAAPVKTVDDTPTETESLSSKAGADVPAAGQDPQSIAAGQIARLGHFHHTRRIDVNAVNHSLAANAAFAVGNVAAFVAEVDGGAEEEDTAGAGVAAGVERQTDFLDRLEEAIMQIKAAGKILINFFQIISTFLKSLDVPWPSVFGAAMSRVSVINLNLVELPAAACLHPSPSYWSQFNGYTLGLLAVMGMSIGTWLVGKHAIAPLALRSVAEEERKERLARLNSTALSRALLILYLVYPGVSVAIFAVFSCTSLETGEAYLDADARITCYDRVHWRYIGGAIIWLLLIPLGVPAFFLFLLRRFKVPQMASLLSDNAWLREAVKLAWAEGLAQPVDAGTLTVDSITTLHLEALFAFYMHDVSAEDAAEILTGARPPVEHGTAAKDDEDPDAPTAPISTRIAASVSSALRRVSRGLSHVAGRATSTVSKRIVLINTIATKVGGDDEGVARRQLVLMSLLTHLKSSGDVAVPALQWERPQDDEVEALRACSLDAVLPHSSGLRCADLPEVMDRAMSELSFLFAAYRVDCWFWEVAELIRKLALTSILALIAPGSAGQVVVGLLIAFVTLLATMSFAPYAQSKLNFIGQATQLHLFFLLLVALLLKLNVDGERDSGFFGGIVVALCVVPVLLPLAMRLYLRFVGGGLEARALVRDGSWE